MVPRRVPVKTKNTSKEENKTGSCLMVFDGRCILKKVSKHKETTWMLE
tara:strand:- start:433 stop:576 length:144 start_codon:yes stop_codon:yes gene_type:complete